MALLFCDSFDKEAVLVDIEKKWDQSFAGGPITTETGGRLGTRRLKLVAPQNNGITAIVHRLKPSTLPDTIIIGFALGLPSYPSYSPMHLVRTEGTSGSRHMVLGLNGTGTISVIRDTTTLATTTETIPNDESFVYVEFKTTIHNTTGSYELRFNGDTVLSASGIDTQNGQTTDLWKVSVQTERSGGNNGYTAYFDDFYICDDTGSTNNDFLGDVHIEAISPTAEGNYSAWTPSSGMDNALLVDDSPGDDGDTTYISTGTTTTKDTYDHADMSATAGAVYGVAVNIVGKKTDSGSRKTESLIRLSATDENGTPKHNLITGYRTFQTIHETKPGGGAWTIADVNNAEFGLELDT